MSAGSRLYRKLAAAGLAACCAAGVAVATASHGGAPARPGLADTAGLAGAGSATAGKPAPPALKGVAAWSFRDVRAALRKSGAKWYYTWSVSHGGIATPKGVSFVPMVWGAGSVTAASLSQAKRVSSVLLGFNEPDLSSQSNMSVSQALSLWPQLMATGMRLGSPAVAAGGNVKGGWLDQFMKGAAARHYRVNFITLHWYGADFATRAAVSQLRSYVQAVWARYHRPIWLTEFALARYGATTTFPSAKQQAAFVTAATAMLRRQRYVWRYAWFALPATTGPTGDGSEGLFRPGAVATAAGRAFERVAP
jgi:putative glycosyl hydrolase